MMLQMVKCTTNCRTSSAENIPRSLKKYFQLNNRILLNYNLVL